MSTHALASLTANYSDSEPEGEEEDRVLQDDVAEKSSEDSGSRAPSVEPQPPPVSEEVDQKVEPSRTTLVSYHDDAPEEEDEESELKVVNTPPQNSSVQLPAEPSGRASPKVVEKLAKLHKRMEDGFDVNASIQNRKDFRNPSIYEKLIQFCGINELGTNYPPSMYDPLKWSEGSYYDKLAAVQKAEMDRREKDKKDKTKKAVVVAEDDPKKRKSKWDQVGSGLGAPTLVRATGLLQSALTTAVSGTKSTVIYAFGSLPKKPKL